MTNKWSYGGISEISFPFWTMTAVPSDYHALLVSIGTLFPSNFCWNHRWCTQLPFHFHSLHFTCWDFVQLSYRMQCVWILLSFLSCRCGHPTLQWEPIALDNTSYFWHGILPAMGDEQSLGPYITMSEISYNRERGNQDDYAITDKLN